LDKMDAIPGVTTQVPQERLVQIISEAGCAIVSATAQIAPADKRLYAIRDVTSTVESLDLITASILSKKLAASPDGLVLDVKLGSGAFMKSRDEARALAKALCETANAAGCRTSALITDMNQPLVPALGNALEVAEVMKILGGDHTGPLVEITAALSGVLLANAGIATDEQDGAARIIEALSSGRVAERFGKMVAAVGGPLSFVEDWRRFLPEADVIREVKAPASGYVTAIDGEMLGLAVVRLGGGRMVESDRVNPAVGLSDLVRLGQKIDLGAPLAVVHAAREDAANAANATVLSAITIAPDPAALPELIHERIS